jgi:hypothetical protein
MTETARAFVYVGGEIGKTPLVVTSTVEEAMYALLKFFQPPDDEEDAILETAWRCRFVGGDPLASEWVTEVTNHGASHVLYIVRCDVETNEASRLSPEPDGGG